MSSILEHVAAAPLADVAPGTVLLSEGGRSGHLYILADGAVEVLRGNTTVAIVAEPGAIFGEMSVLLDLPHTATVKALSPAKVYAIDDAGSFLRAHPDIAFSLARLLAQRLNAATTYLVDIKRQFAGESTHLGMVGEILESLMHQPDEAVAPGSDREPDPRM